MTGVRQAGLDSGAFRFEHYYIYTVHKAELKQAYKKMQIILRRLNLHQENEKNGMMPKISKDRKTSRTLQNISAPDIWKRRV
jgi:hypothetical protein